MTVGYCNTVNCLVVCPPNRKRCSKCRKRDWRKNNPIKAADNHSRSNAKRRGIEFTISFEYWQAFCAAYRYIENKGMKADSITVERENDNKGYVEGNLTVLTRKENVTKENRRRAARNN